MPSLAELTDYYPQQDSSDALPVESVVPDADGVRRVVITKPTPAPDGSADGGYFTEPMAEVVGNNGFLDEPFSKGTKIGNKLFGTGGEERYQTWPEKVIREGLVAAHDVATGQTPDYEIDPSTYDVHTSPQMIQSAQAMSALAGTGGLAGADASLGSSPFLRPALKYEGKIYKAPKTLSEGGEHGDAIPAHLDELFIQQAMSGEDISNFNFGFLNHKGQFLDREKALDYGINEGLIDPSAGKFGALTSTMMADSSKPGTAIEAMAKAGDFKIKPPKTLYRGIVEGAQESGAQGLGTSHLGKGLYTSADKSFAKKYASKGEIKEFTPEDAFPRNPLVLNGAGGAGNLLMDYVFKNTNFKNAREFNKAYPDVGEFVRSLGHDGVVTNNGEEIVKYPRSLFADSSKEGSAIQANKQGFYSALEHNVNAIQQGKMTGDQWLGTLSNKPGVKPEELDWTGVKSFLEEKGKQPVTKAELQEHLQNNKVELKEVNKGGDILQHKAVYDPESELWDIHDKNGKVIDTGYHDQRAADREILNLAGHEQSIDGGAELNRGTKYHSYQLAGGSNYREKLLTLPSKEQLPPGFKSFKSDNGSYGIEFPNGSKLDGWKTEEAAIRSQAMQKDNPQYKSSHWDEPNILAHVRMNDRMMEGATPEQIQNISERLAKYFNTNVKFLGSGSPETGVKKGIITEQEAADITKAKGWINKFKGLPGSEKKSLHIEEIQSDFLQAHRAEQVKIVEAVNKDFDGIADRMVKAGVIKKICD